MQKSYRKNFFKIYFWKGLSILLNMVSMFVVAPTLSTNPTIYGTYMLCVSLNIFLAYADIGFINAGFKYAAEYHSKGDLFNEMKVIGFSVFILGIFLTIPFVFFLVLSHNPYLLLTDLGSESNALIASKLLLIQSIFTYSVLLAKYNQLVFGIRLKNDKINQVSIIVYLIKITSLAYFFRKDSYDIVGYFLFGKIVESLGYIINSYLTTKYFNYNILFVIKSFKFSKTIFKKTKSLAIASFFGTLMWIIYAELDSLVIAKFLGVEVFAYFAIGLSLTKFMRSIFAVIFMPFNARFNHFVGQNELDKLKTYFIKVLKTIFPIIFLLTLTIIMLREALVLSWVGKNYNISIDIILFLLLAMIFNPVKNLSSLMANALEKIKLIYFVNIIMIVTYWSIIFILIDKHGIMSFAYAKFLSFVLSNIIFLFAISKVINTKFLKLGYSLLKPVILPSILIVFISSVFITNFNFYKSSYNLLFVIFTGGMIFLTSFIVLYFTSKEIKEEIKKIFLMIQLRLN